MKFNSRVPFRQTAGQDQALIHGHSGVTGFHLSFSRRVGGAEFRNRRKGPALLALANTAAAWRGLDPARSTSTLPEIEPPASPALPRTSATPAYGGLTLCDHWRTRRHSEKRAILAGYGGKPPNQAALNPKGFSGDWQTLSARGDPLTEERPAVGGTTNRAEAAFPINESAHYHTGETGAQDELERELREAARLARDPRCVVAVDTLNLRIDAAAWGVGFVELDGYSYQLNADGDPAFIVAAEADGELVDLVAVRLVDRALATRRGVAAILGKDAIDVSHKWGSPLLLYDDALAWMAGGFLGAVLLDWQHAHAYLADLPAIWCANAKLARRVHDVLTVPSHLPEISFARAA